MAADIPLKIFKAMRPKILCVVLSVIFVAILGMKIAELIRSGPIIANELVAPESLSKQGALALQSIGATCDLKGAALDLQIPSLTTLDRQALENTRQIVCGTSFADPFNPHAESWHHWIASQTYIAESDSAWRGRYLHHYSTILFPYRQIEAGYLGYAFTSQYGLISLIPLFLIPNSAFVLYGALSLFLLLIFGTYFLYRHRESSSEVAMIGGIFILIALVTYVPAIRLAPGFAFIRYLPLVLLITLADLQVARGRFVYIAPAVVLALLNSLQFNILFFAIASVSYLFSAINEKKWNGIKLYLLPISVLLVALWQATLYLMQSNSFTPSLFSSAGQGNRSYLYAAEILLFPVACKLISYSRIFFDRSASRNLLIDSQEILGIVSYGLCAAYALSFLGSPQHFAGFLMMASLSIFILMKKCCKSALAIVIALGLLLISPLHYGYFSLGKKLFLQKSELFDYKNQIGYPIFFKTALEISLINKEYSEITKLSQSEGKTYFISKDKIFIEAYINKNIEPKVYDVFTNYQNISSEQALRNYKLDQVSYLVLDNGSQRKYSQSIAEYFKGVIGISENRALQEILDNIESLSVLLSPNLIKCNSRYCLYKL